MNTTQFDNLTAAQATDTVKTMREKIVAFVKSEGGIADRSKIKAHLGIEDWRYNPAFERATKTTRLVPVFGDGHIGSGLYLRRKPIVAYRLA